MNPLTKVKLINELNEREADLGVSESVSWHTEYRDSAWIFVGGFPYELTEGDLICVFSQYGEVVNINLVRDKKTGKSKGFCFICYEDQRSTVLAVDNFNGIKIKGRTIRVDHVKNYRPPKDGEDIDDVTRCLREDGCAPTAPVQPSSSSSDEDVVPVKKNKKDKKEKKRKKEKKDKKKRQPSSSPPPSPPHPPIRVKEEKMDIAYDKYNQRGTPAAGQQDGQRTRETDRHWNEEKRMRGRDEDRRREGREMDRERGRETDRDRRDDRRETDREDRDRRDDRRETDREDRDRQDDRRETDREDRDRRDDRRETDREDRDRRRDADKRKGNGDRGRDERRRETDRDYDRRWY